MKKEKSKKLFNRIMWVFGILTIVLAIHIYWVTRPKAPDPHTIVMARIDIKNSLNQDDASKIKTWLYQQKGVDHVVVNPKTQIALFTFYPAKASGDQIVQKFQTAFNYDAERYIPTKEEMANSCPALPASVTEKISAFIKHNL
jgi:copper chaperone CopZ